MKNTLKVVENGLVPVYETSTGEKVVYGTELHEVLGVKSNYRDWVKNRLNDIDAVENEDFEAAKILAPSGQRFNQHIIKLDIAKEMAMLERNEKGKQVRRYFIQIEKKYKKQMMQLASAMEQFMAYQKESNERQEEINSILWEKLEAATAKRKSGIWKKGDESHYSREQEIIENRKKNLYKLTAESASLFGESQTSTLHQMYRELEERLGIVLDSYKAVYRSETGRYGAGMVEVIAANDKMYELAVEMNEYVLGKKRIYS